MCGDFVMFRNTIWFIAMFTPYLIIKQRAVLGTNSVIYIYILSVLSVIYKTMPTIRGNNWERFSDYYVHQYM